MRNQPLFEGKSTLETFTATLSAFPQLVYKQTGSLIQGLETGAQFCYKSKVNLKMNDFQIDECQESGIS